MRLSAMKRSFLFGVAVGAAAVLVVGFLDLKIRPDADL
jgi:hypothetical protein